MTCDRAKELFSELLEGTLDAGLRQNADRHLQSCPACEHEFDAFRSLYARLGGWPEVNAPDDLSEKIFRHLDKADWDRKQAKPAGRTIFRIAFAGAVAAVVVAGIFVKNSSSGVEANLVPVPESRPLSVEMADGKVHLRMKPGPETKIWISQGGNDFSAVPPKDAKILRHKEVGLQAYDVPLNVSAQDPDIVWVTVAGGTSATAIIFPRNGSVKVERLRSNLVEALQAVADKYGNVIEARLTEAGAVRERDLTKENIAQNLDSVLEGTKLRYTVDGGLIHIQ